MKGAVLAVFCALALTRGALIVEKNECPRDPRIEKLLPHPNCNHYFQCENGQKIKRSCPLGLHFSPESQVCDFPKVAKCEGEHFVLPTNPILNIDPNKNEQKIHGYDDPSQAPAICATEYSSGILVAHEICNRFYKCTFGKPVAIRCPGILLYDPSIERCEWPEFVDCGNRELIGDDDVSEGEDWNGNGAGNNDPSLAPSICAQNGSDHVHIAHENCNQFYQCWAGVPIALNCPDGFLFDPLKDYCDWPQKVDCGNRGISENDGNDAGNDTEDEIKEEEIPVGNNHNNYTQANEICKRVDSEGVLVAHKNCDQFYKCNFGLPVEQICPNGLLFDPSTDRCEWPQFVTCGDRIIPQPQENDTEDEWTGNGAGNDDPSQAAAICLAEGSNHIHVAHENCNQYYQCWAGKPEPLNCPPGFLFNPYKDYCDWPHNVDCGNRLIPDKFEINVDNANQSGHNDGNTEEEIPVGNNFNDPSQAHLICRSEKSENVLIAHKNCNQYYRCNFGFPVVQSCPGNLFFDPSRDSCEWRHIVQCGNRIIPDEIDNQWPGDGAGSYDQAAAICAVEESAHAHVAHENCNQYYQCWAGRPVPLKCPDGLFFNAKVNYCDFPDKVECSNKFIPENLTNIVYGGKSRNHTESIIERDIPVKNNHNYLSQAVAICAVNNSEGVLIPHENCNQYYICNFGIPVTQTCSGNLLFNPSSNTCDWRRIVDCGIRYVPDEMEIENQPNIIVGAGNDDPSQAKTICAAEGSDNIYIAHENCNYLYQCWDGYPVVLKCPDGFYFNPKVDYCDYAENFVCHKNIGSK